MNCLIVYMSHHGTTKKIAEQIGNQLEAVVVNLDEDPDSDPAPYDTVIIGGSIHAGAIQGKIKKYCVRHEEILLQKKLGLYLCFMDKEHSITEFDHAYPENLRQHATVIGLFGGELLLEKMNFLEKIVVKKISGVKESKHEIDEDAITAFIDKIRQQ